MRQRLRFSALLLLSGCASQVPAPSTPATTTPAPPAVEQPVTRAPTTTTRYDGAGHTYATAIQLAGASNPLAFSQKQQEWLWLNYRDWKKQGQALREQDGVQYDEVTLINKQGETQVIYFRMPKRTKP